MVKKQNCFLCQNLEAAMAHFIFFVDCQNLGNLQKFGKFLKLEVTLILHNLLTELLHVLMQTKLALV